MTGTFSEAPAVLPVESGSHEWLIPAQRCQQWLEAFPFPRQRNTKPKGIERLIWALVHDKFVPTGMHIYYCNETARFYILDGQHRLTAAAQCGAVLEEVVFIRILDTFAEIVDAYEHIDAGVLRSLRDRLKARGTADHLGFTKTQFDVLQAAVPCLMDGFESSTPAAAVKTASISDVRALACTDWAEWADTYFQCVGRSSNRESDAGSQIFRRSVVVAFALVTLRWQEDYAEVFWRTVAEADRLKAGTGEHRLYQLLLSRPLRSSGYNDYARRIASCWNASFQGRPLSCTLVKNAAAPINIEGTPYRGNKHLKLDYSTEPVVPAEVQFKNQGVQLKSLSRKKAA